MNISNIDHAASQSDRWMFIATLVLLIVAAGIVARYFVKKYDELSVDSKESTKNHEDRMNVLIGDYQKNNNILAVSLDRNTAAFERNTLAFNDCSMELKHCREERRK